MSHQKKLARLAVLASLLVLPVLLAGCGAKPVPQNLTNNNQPIDQSAGQNGGLTPAGQSTGTSENPFENGPQDIKEIKSDADIENMLNGIDSGDKSNKIKTVDESDINNF